MNAPDPLDQEQSDDEPDGKPAAIPDDIFQTSRVTAEALQNRIRQPEQTPIQDDDDHFQVALNSSAATILDEPVGMDSAGTNVSTRFGNCFFSSFQPLSNSSTANACTQLASVQNPRRRRRNRTRVARSNDLAADIRSSLFTHMEPPTFSRNRSVLDNDVQSSLPGQNSNNGNNNRMNNSHRNSSRLNQNVGNHRERANTESNHSLDENHQQNNFLTDYSYWCPHRSHYFPLWEVLRHQYWIDIDHRNLLRRLRLIDEDNGQSHNCLLDPILYCRYQECHVCIWQLLRNQYIADMIAKGLGYRQTVTRLSKKNHYCPIQKQEIPICLLVKNQANADIKARNHNNYSQLPEQYRGHITKCNCLHDQILFCPRTCKYVTLFELLLNEHNATGLRIIYVVNEGGHSGYEWEIPDEFQQHRPRSEEVADPSITYPIQPLELSRWKTVFVSMFADLNNRVSQNWQYNTSAIQFSDYLLTLTEEEEVEEEEVVEAEVEEEESKKEVPEEIRVRHFLTDDTQALLPLEEWSDF